MFSLNHLRQLAHPTNEDVAIRNSISKSADCFLSLFKYCTMHGNGYET